MGRAESCGKGVTGGGGKREAGRNKVRWCGKGARMEAGEAHFPVYRKLKGQAALVRDYEGT